MYFAVYAGRDYTEMRQEARPRTDRGRRPLLPFCSMNPQDPQYKNKVSEIFNKAAFISDLGIKLKDVGPGWCETTLEIQPKHLQQDTFIHAGVQATMADHTAGASAGSLVKENEIVLTVEFKINLLRPAIGKTLRCRAQVLRPGNNLIVSESEVFAVNTKKEKLVAKAMVTLAVVGGKEV